ncbi:hypothetical protein PNP59_04840 [Halobacterium salinarum]|uniref:hypothetical protein n=1 Tax=Halobacterium salinarum TaxID=2242 RepID=UPI002553DB0B|nr:hypothetical protein [Halobacterium salinarum]MDL0130264.1 hypothetical protein [Halobacterium salinarum]
MTDSDSDEQGELRGIQIGSVHIGPIEYHFLKLAIYSVVGLFVWPYLLLLYIYLSVRRFNKNLAKLSKRASRTVREEYKAGYEEGESED